MSTSEKESVVNRSLFRMPVRSYLVKAIHHGIESEEKEGNRVTPWALRFHKRKDPGNFDEEVKSLVTAWQRNLLQFLRDQASDREEVVSPVKSSSKRNPKNKGKYT